MEEYDLIVASEAARFNREQLEKDKKCGCYSCLNVFSPSEIKEWGVEEENGKGVTAICPHCGVDSVLAASSGYPLTKTFLKSMNDIWFGENYMIELYTTIRNLKERKQDIEKYADILKKVSSVDIANDENFQKEFTYFYRVRRNDDWRKSFYALFSECRDKKGLSFDYILREIYRLTGRIEASFSSKLFATLNPDMPIWDSIVLSKLRMSPEKTKNKEKRLSEAVETYHELDYWYRGFLQSKGSKDFIKAFDKAFPEYKWFSSVKKIDFILWGSGDADPLPQKTIEINGCVEVPLTVSEDEFMDKFIRFIKDNHWYFGGGVKEDIEY